LFGSLTGSATVVDADEKINALLGLNIP
jgi:hypothetical protein